MYHIWSAECQIQISATKIAKNLELSLHITPAHNRGKLANAIGPGFAGVDEGDDLMPPQCRFHFRKAGNRGSSLAGKRQRRERCVGQTLLDAVGETGLELHRLPVSARKKPALFSEFDMIGARRNPYSATRKSAAKVGHDFTVGRDDETDQCINRRCRAGYDAGPFCLASTVLHGVLICQDAEAPSAPAASSSTSSSSGWRSSSVIQPTLMRAAMIIASASARDNSKPSSEPG